VNTKFTKMEDIYMSSEGLSRTEDKASKFRTVCMATLVSDVARASGFPLIFWNWFTHFDFLVNGGSYM